MKIHLCRQVTFLSFLFIIICVNKLSAQTAEELDLLVTSANAAYRSGNMSEAIRLHKEEIEMRKELKQHYNLIGNAIHELAIVYSSYGKPEKAIETEMEAMETYRKMRPVDKDLIGTSYGSIATFYYMMGGTEGVQKAIENAELSLKTSTKKTENYVNTANLLIVCYSQTGQSAKAEKLNKDIFKLGRKVFGEKNTKYAQILSNHALQLAKNKNLKEALVFANESMDIYLEAEDTVNLFFSKLLMHTATIHRDSENYTEAIGLLERAKSILTDVEGVSGISYQQCIGELSSLYAKVGNLERSNDLLYSMRNVEVSKKSNLNAISLTKQAQTYAASGNYSQGISILNEAVKIYEEHHDSIGIANAYITMSSYYHRSKKTAKAIETCNQAISILENRPNEQDVMARAYNNLAIFKRATGSTSEAIDYCLKALECSTAIGDTLSTDYADLLGNLAIYYFESGDTDKALSYGLHSYELKKKMLGDKHPDHALSLYNLSNYYFKKGDRAQAYKYYHEAFIAQSEIVRKNFTHMSTNGRENYWNTKKFVYTMAPVYVYGAQKSDSLILNDAYNAQLFTKGILLNSEIDFKTLLLRSGNQTLLDQYNQLTKLHDEIDELYNKGTVEDAKIAEDKVRESIILERNIIRNSKEYGDYTSNMYISAVKIAQSLKDDEVAVELYEIPNSTGGNAYFALYLRKDWTAPRFVHLFLSKNLESVEFEGQNFFQMLKKRNGVNHIFNSDAVGRLVWDPLIRAWKNDGSTAEVRNIYFSPVGMFYKWGIEYLKINDTQRICDLYNVYRLSSTKQLTQRSTQQPIANATLFGGIDYSISTDSMRMLHAMGTIDYKATYMTYDVDLERDIAQNVTPANDNVRSILGDDDENSDDTDFKGEDLRAGVSPLSGTFEEVQAIGEQLLQRNIPANILTHYVATEENFKALSGQEQSLVHIATHGFSFNEGSKSRKALSYLLGRNNAAKDNPMHYSGLLFAGANNVFGKHMKMPKDIEDGIVTASEISALDLRGLDLVVLSACQTGLGDVKDDGVFGLQRGFKKAGAHTILMSLWSVSDKATRIMMTNFYTALMNGSNRHDALRYAQQQVRNAGFTDPYYWAAFIMLDDI